MIDLFSLYEEATSALNTHQGGILRPARDFNAWVKTISLEIFRELVAKAQKDNFVDDALHPFLKSVNVFVTPAPGQMYDIMKYPADYEGFCSARLRIAGGGGCGDPGLGYCTGEGKICDEPDPDQRALMARAAEQAIDERPITKVSTNRWSALTAHRTQRPKLPLAYCTQFDGGLKIAPKNIGVIILDYFRLPVAPVFAYTVVNAGTENEYYQYDAARSTPLEWSESMRGEFITRLKARYASKNQDGGTYQQALMERRQEP